MFAIQKVWQLLNLTCITITVSDRQEVATAIQMSLMKFRVLLRYIRAYARCKT